MISRFYYILPPYRQNLLEKARPLCELLKENVPLLLQENHQPIFQALKPSLTEHCHQPKCYNTEQSVEVHCDCSKGRNRRMPFAASCNKQSNKRFRSHSVCKQSAHFNVTMLPQRRNGTACSCLCN